MKRITVIVMLALLLLAAPAAMAKSTVTVNPLGLLSNVASIGFETQTAQLGGDKTFLVQVSSWNPSLGRQYRHVRATGFGGGMRYYLDGLAHDGVYIGGYGSLINVGGTVSGDPIGARILSVTAVAGYKWNFSSGLVVDVGAAMGLPLSTKPLTSNVTEETFINVTGTDLYVGLGYAF